MAVSDMPALAAEDVIALQQQHGISALQRDIPGKKALTSLC